MVERAELGRSDRVDLLVGVADGDDRGPFVAGHRAHPLEDLIAVAAGHDQIEDDEIEILARDRSQRFFARRGFRHLVTVKRDDRADQRTSRGMVVDDQDACQRSSHLPPRPLPPS